MADKIYDLSQLEELAGGSDEFVKSMIETFLEHTPGQLNDLVQAYRQGDLETMAGIAHKIKPNIDLFGINEIREDIRQVEKLGKTGQNSDELPALIDKVNTILNKSFEQLKSH